MKIPFEKIVLRNGLEVVLHEDHADPVVAVFVTYHVGSSRESIGRSGFAHLFEHMLFQGSEHVPDDQHFKLVQEAGGTLNGTTNQDRTNYYEVLPSNQLELALWLEADRMGFLLPAMTQGKLDNQRDVVKNERRQSYENRPYGLVHETILEHLYPEGHPYSWPTIGSMADIDRATLEDVNAFFRSWYGPNNATLSIAGDFHRDETLQQIDHWFGDIPRGPEVDVPAPAPAKLASTQRVVIEDRVALPQLSLVWPTVPWWTTDEPALDLLVDYLSANKASVLDRVLTIDEELASHVTIQHATGERGGYLRLDLRPHAGVTLADLERRVDNELQKVALAEIDAGRLDRLKARHEGMLLRSLETVAARANALGHYNCFFGDPGRLGESLSRHRKVTPGDVVDVARRYLCGRPRLSVATVPTGRTDLAPQPRGATA